MAQRRMFSKKIVETDHFMEMSPTAKLLYFYLNMSADDDGFVGNPKTIKLISGATDDDFKILIAKQFLIPFESGVIVIKDWKIHNYIRNDRYTETQYREEKKQLTVSENGSYSISGIPNVNQMSYQMDTQDRLGKDRLGKVNKNIMSDKSDDVIPYFEIINYFNQKTGKKLSPKASSNKKWIKSRWNEGYTVDDFKKVIDIKFDEWVETDMYKYMRPETLFGNKFDGYLNQIPTKKQAPVGSRTPDWVVEYPDDSEVTPDWQ